MSNTPLRLPVELDAPLRQRAEADGRSLNDELVAILSAALSSTPEQAADAVPIRNLEHLAH